MTKPKYTGSEYTVSSMINASHNPAPKKTMKHTRAMIAPPVTAPPFEVPPVDTPATPPFETPPVTTPPFEVPPVETPPHGI